MRFFSAFSQKQLSVYANDFFLSTSTPFFIPPLIGSGNVWPGQEAGRVWGSIAQHMNRNPVKISALSGCPSFKKQGREFPGGPVAKTPHFHRAGAVQSLVGELRSHIQQKSLKMNRQFFRHHVFAINVLEFLKFCLYSLFIIDDNLNGYDYCVPTLQFEMAGHSFKTLS